MTKKRLNNNHRRVMIDFAEKHVKCEEEHMKMISTYNAACIAVRAVVEAAYPPEDMALLSKYNVTMNDRCIKGVCSEGSDTVIGFEFETDEEAPLVPRNGSCRSRVLKFNVATCELIFEAARAKKDFEKVLETKMTAYRSLIWDARYFEDVLEYWPAVAAIRDKICAPGTSLSRFSPELAEFIRADNAGAIAA